MPPIDHPLSLEPPTRTAAEYARRIARRQLRRKALDTRRAEIARELGERRQRQAAALAAGSGAPKINARALVELREEDEALAAALEHVARELDELEGLHAAAVLQEARDAERARVAAAVAAATELEACARRLLDPATGELGLALATLDAAMRAVHEAQDAHDGELRRQQPQGNVWRSDQAEAVWKRHPSLGPLLSAIRTFLEPPHAGLVPPPAA